MKTFGLTFPGDPKYKDFSPKETIWLPREAWQFAPENHRGWWKIPILSYWVSVVTFQGLRLSQSSGEGNGPGREDRNMIEASPG